MLFATTCAALERGDVTEMSCAHGGSRDPTAREQQNKNNNQLKLSKARAQIVADRLLRWQQGINTKWEARAKAQHQHQRQEEDVIVERQRKIVSKRCAREAVRRNYEVRWTEDGLEAVLMAVAK